MKALQDISKTLSRAVAALRFPAPITHVYNPLHYAAAPHHDYLARYGRQSCEIVLVGMNPGPFGMAQTGVPFGDIVMVRDWMGIEAPVGKPTPEHPKRPILGFDCPRREVSGSRLWGWAQERFKTPDAFFERFFVHNYCPLCFMEESGKNFTPDKLPAALKNDLFGYCDQALAQLVDVLQPKYVVGVGAFAEARIRAALPKFEGDIGRVLHPSPASPAANRGWAEAAERDFLRLGIRL